LLAANPDDDGRRAVRPAATLWSLRSIPRHRSNLTDGVRLNPTSSAVVRDAAEQVIGNAARMAPDARISGVTVQPMISRHRPAN
jgi:acyl-CoA synthetase (NDP forming)